MPGEGRAGSRRQSASSKPSLALKNRMCGTVASPTPTVPISSRLDQPVRTARGGNTRDSAAAVIQPYLADDQNRIRIQPSRR
jgi:hypothetical protein